MNNYTVLKTFKHKGLTFEQRYFGNQEIKYVIVSGRYPVTFTADNFWELYPEAKVN